MAKFIGTKKEYTDFIGPRIRNIVNIIAKKEKSKCNKKCQMCGEENIELEAAHKHGKERKVITSKILDKYLKGNIIEIDIKDIENEIKKAHYPIEKTFIFVCKKCHRKCDGKPKNKTDKGGRDDIKEIAKVKRKIPRWLRNTSQINSRILLTYLKEIDGRTMNYTSLKNKCGLGEKFDTNFQQMTAISRNNHAKVFEIHGNQVKLWNKVDKFILSEYKGYGPDGAGNEQALQETPDCRPEALRCKLGAS